MTTTAAPHAADRLILASTSAYRRDLLLRFRLAFDTSRPEVDETPHPAEAPERLAARLAVEKASAVARRHPQAWVIGSDQVAELEGRPLGKPGDRAGAVGQLQTMSGRDVIFHTVVCLARQRSRADLDLLTARDRTLVRFRQLGEGEIERYVDAEQPFDCAGSFKCEGLGITLFDAIESNDPTALIGLPLIATGRLLREAGFRLP
ncbi:MAG: Maf family nucleotide pyrophosphatase [Pseudomonadota bacterium]|nr:Maf family nucleotide pyrophosphatase [Pseudomonadota bacterium]